MSIIKDYKIEDRLEGKVLVVYIKPYFVELANEGEDITKNSSLRDEIYKIINKKLSQSKVVMCKIMLGGILVGTIYSQSLPAAASTYESSVQNTVQYTVKSGDTLWKIASRYDISVEDIQIANNLTHSTIYVDQIIDIPTNSYGSYTVKTGDTLYKIATTNNTTVDRIKELNQLTSNLIYEGQTLVLDNVTTTSETTASTYTVKAGDTLWKISSENNVSVDTIKDINNLSSNTIYVGQVLNLTSSGGTTTDTTTDTTTNTEAEITYITYEVKQGDTQWSIAIDHGIPVSELQSVNNFTNSTGLSIGQDVTIPVHNVPVMETQGEQFGEYLDWWDSAQYVFPINAVAEIEDLTTGQTFTIKRTIGANHADCEPLTAEDTAIAKEIWGGYSWVTRPVLVKIDGREIAASMSFMPHDIQYITNNNFDGHFDIHFLNSTRHVDGQIDTYHQESIKEAAGLY